MGSKIYVGKLPSTVTDKQLKDLFATHGRVDSAEILKDRFTGQSRGFGFVEMSSDAEAQAAIDALNASEIGGRAILQSSSSTDLEAAVKEFDGEMVSEGTRESQQQPEKSLTDAQDSLQFRTARMNEPVVSMQVKMLEPVREAAKHIATAHGMTAQEYVEHLLVETLNKNSSTVEEGKKRLEQFKGSTSAAKRFAERLELERLRDERLSSRRG